MDYKIYSEYVNVISLECVGYGTVIGTPGAIRGCNFFDGTVEIGADVYIGANVTIARGEEGATVIGDRCMVMNNALIGHNVEIGNDCEIGGGS